MIFSSILKALGQLDDARFLRVTGMGIGLSVALLVGLYAILVVLVGALAPETITLPWLGDVNLVHRLLDWASLALILVLSVFLMIPVAALFSGFFLDRVADAVEDEHYPDLPPLAHQSILSTLWANLSFAALIVAANLIGLFAYVLSGPFAPLVFVGLNGWLLGREYFDLAATRRIGPSAARDLRKRNAGTIWVAGMIMCAPLTIPIVNLFVPVLGAATFTHLFHAVQARTRR